MAVQRATVDPISLEIFKNVLTSIPEEMGVTLVRTGYSTNIKERADISCAFFDAKGRLVAQAAHQPVHLGSMPASVKVAIELFTFDPGDHVILNDPYLGGTHLPDITLVSPTFTEKGGGELFGFVANRAHHADVGGMAPGSIPASTEIYQEGIIIPPLKIIKAGKLHEDLFTLICRNVRTPEERRGDMDAQIAANSVGEKRIHEIIARYGVPVINAHIDALIEYSERMMRSVISAIPDGRYSFEDYLDDDGVVDEPVRFAVEITVAGGELIVDFTGSSPQRLGCINAVLAVTYSVVLYVVSCIAGERIPSNAGSLAPVKVIAPPSSVVNASPPAAVVGGNLEASQRMVDILFGAFSQALPDLIPAASQGTMNTLTIGGYDPFRQQPYTFCETVGGGMGARPRSDGLSTVHTHMTNTKNTPMESLEIHFPLRISTYGRRYGSGGNGKFKGGDGIERRYYFLAPGIASLIADRRKFAPYGLYGGGPGKKGENLLRKKDGTLVGLPSKFTHRFEEGEELIIRTPGGGGWGKPE